MQLQYFSSRSVSVLNNKNIMAKQPKDLSIILMPDGPISYDGNSYKYSKGERFYIDNLANDFKKIYLATFVLRVGDEAYESNLHSSFKSDNIEIIELPRAKTQNPSFFGKVYQFIKVFFVLIMNIRKADLAYFFLPSYPSALGWVASKIFRKKHIVYGADDWVQASESMYKWEINNTKFLYKLYSKLNIFFERKIVQSALFAVAAGGQLVEKYSNFGCPSFPTSPRMTLKLSDFVKREDTCSKETINLVNVGALIHDKDQANLLRSFRIAESKIHNKDLRLKIIGEGPEKNNLFDLASELGIIDKVDFLGYVENEKELLNLLRSYDVFVLSSVTEGFPRVLYESMTSSLPIVTTNVGGIPYLLDDKHNAIIVKSRDPKSLAQGILTIIKDDNLRRSIIHNASNTMKNIFKSFDSHQIARLVVKYFD